MMVSPQQVVEALMVLGAAGAYRVEGEFDIHGIRSWLSGQERVVVPAVPVGDVCVNGVWLVSTECRYDAVSGQ